MSRNVGAVVFKGADGSLDHGDVLSAVSTAEPLFFPAVSLQTVCLLAVSKQSSAAIAHNRANVDSRNN